MINHKYRSIFTICLAGLILSIFCPRVMRDYFPTAWSQNSKVNYYCFCKHYWILNEAKRQAFEQALKRLQEQKEANAQG